MAQQAASGISNADIGRRLFLSVNTVETHLKRVFAKLDITSRRQLMVYDLPDDADTSRLLPADNHGDQGC